MSPCPPDCGALSAAFSTTGAVLGALIGGGGGAAGGLACGPGTPACSTAFAGAGALQGAAVGGAAGFLVGAAIENAIDDLVYVFARGGRLQPDPNAAGAHSTFRRDPETGRVTKYDTFVKNARGFWERVKSFQLFGRPHFNKATGERVPTPHVQEGKTVRPPQPWEIPQ